MRPSPAGSADGDPTASGQAVRLFVAARVPAEALADLGRRVDALAVTRAGARLTARERWHVTLAFLGETPADRVGAAADALTAAAARSAPMRLRLAGGGTFGGGRAAILWSGLTGVTDHDLTVLRALARSVRRELRAARLPVDDQRFRPHLTLARPGRRLDRDALAGDVAALHGYTGPAFTLDEIVLYHSRLGPDPEHTALATAHLRD